MSLGALSSGADPNSSALMASPFAARGSFVERETLKVTMYRGESLRYFLAKNGANPQDMRQFLLDNRIGRVFDLEPGIPVKLPKPDSHYFKPDEF